MDNEKFASDSFRDSLSTVDKEGKRIWVWPKKPSGKFYRWRSIVSYFLLVLLFATPFLKIHGDPLLMLNIIERRFVILGVTFWPQDMHFFVLFMITGLLFIILFTIIFGRLFCGWVCPQTIFMEMLFRKIEYWIDGDWTEQKKLAQSPWTKEKVLKRFAKLGIFYVISFAIANVFLAYIIGGDKIIEIITDHPSNHVGGLITILIFSGVFFAVFTWLREQVCTTVCPYGRLQGVLLDKNSIVVAYDYLRGETRAKMSKGEDRPAAKKGDCIDCKLCVHVCPTGIDIRNGTQLECTNCTACIDACDDVMEKVGFEKGLIRYASENDIAEKKPFQFTVRIKLSMVVLALLIGIFFTVLFTRNDVETTLLRTPGLLFQEVDSMHVSNLYNFKVLNKTNREFPVTFELEDQNGEIKMIGKNIFVHKSNFSEGALFIILDKNQIKHRKTKITIGVYTGDKLLEKIKTNFIANS